MSQTAKKVRAESMPPEEMERNQEMALGAEQAAGSAAPESAALASGAAPEVGVEESGATESVAPASEDPASGDSASENPVSGATESGASGSDLDPDHPRRRELPALLRRGLSFGWAKKDAASRDQDSGPAQDSGPDQDSSQDQVVSQDPTPDSAGEPDQAADPDQAVGQNPAAHPDHAGSDQANPGHIAPDKADPNQAGQTQTPQEDTSAQSEQAGPDQAAPVTAYAPPPRPRFPIYLALAGMALVLVLYIIGLNSSLAEREAALKEQLDGRLNGFSQQLGAAEGRIASLETRQDGIEATMERKITARQVAELRQSLELLAAQADPSERERLARAKALLDELEAALN